MSKSQEPFEFDMHLDQTCNDLDLYNACEMLDLDHVKEALKHSKAVNFVDVSTNHTCLMAAAIRGHTEICLHLIKAGAAKDTNLGEGTALKLADAHGHTDTVKQLILAGCVVPFTLRDKYKTTMFARTAGVPTLLFMERSHGGAGVGR